MLLIHPPVAKPCEPPAGIARLAGALRKNGHPCTLLDANLEAQLFLLAKPEKGSDTWSRRAAKNLAANLTALRTLDLYNNPARYQRAVADVNRVLEITGKAHNITLSIANYQDQALSPQQSGDLIHAAASPEKNIFYPYFSRRLLQLLAENRSGMVGFSLNYLSQALCTFAMIGYLKSQFPELVIVLGGGLVTTWLSNPAWQNPFTGLVDHMISGPGEEKLLALLKCKSRSSPVPPAFNDLPLADYLAPGVILPYAASSGCYWNKCSFCPEKTEKNPYVPLTSDRVIDEVKQLVAQTNPVLVHFLDNAISPGLMQALIKNPPGVDWYGFARVHENLTDSDFCRALRRSGCVMLKLGIESGDQDVLDSMNKGIDLAMVSKAFATLKKAGIATYVYLLFGTPQESITEARRTLEFTAQHSDAIGFINLAVFNMPRCSQEAKQNPTNTVLYEGDLSLYTDFIHSKGWDRKAVRHFLDREFKRHPAIAEIIRRDPSLFTSNHASFFSPNFL